MRSFEKIEKTKSTSIELIFNLALCILQDSDAILYSALAKEMASCCGQLFRFGSRFWAGESLLRDDKLAKDVWNLSKKLVGLVFDSFVLQNISVNKVLQLKKKRFFDTLP